MWEAFSIPARPWPAEVGLQLVKEDLYSKGVPIAYMQLDDWWYQVRFEGGSGLRGGVGLEREEGRGAR